MLNISVQHKMLKKLQCFTMSLFWMTILDLKTIILLGIALLLAMHSGLEKPLSGF